MCFAAVASADDEQYEFTNATPIAAAPGVDRAQVAKISWCDGVTVSDRWKSDRIERSIDSSVGRNGIDIDAFVEAAEHMCEKPASPKWIAYANNIVQLWMNQAYFKQADAERTLHARMRPDFKAQHDALCSALQPSPEAAGQVKTYAHAQRSLFGCEGNVAWLDSGVKNSAGVQYYLDGEVSPDPLMRLYWLAGQITDPHYWPSPLPATTATDNRTLLYYAVAAPDFARIDPGAIDKVLAAAPYNDYAKAIAHETIAALQARRDVYEAVIAKLTANDPDYKTILRDAPAAAYSRWDDASKKWKDELARSAAFELLISAPSHKAMKGCSTQLAADADKVIKSEKVNTLNELVNAIASDPVASLLLQRLEVCYAVDEVWGMSGALDGFREHHSRGLRGPRSLAYYAIVDAISAAKKDRPRMVLAISNFWGDGGPLGMDVGFNKDEYKFTGRAPDKFGKVPGVPNNNHGTVASTKKVGNRIQLTFNKVKVKVPDFVCTDDTSHPLAIEANGNIPYYRTCRWPGTSTIEDLTPEPMMVASQLAPLLTPGTFVEWEPIPEGAKMAGVVIDTKKSADAKTITSFFGFAL